MIKKRLAVFMIAVFIMSLPAVVNAQFANEMKLLASDGAVEDWFGYSVSISGDTAIVGAYNDDDNGSDSGSAYVYQETAATGPEIYVTDSIGVDNDLQMPFGDVLAGSSSTVETATITNAGNAALNVSNIQLTGTDTGEYTLDLTGGTSPCGSTAPTVPAAGTNCTVTVTFSPTSTGPKTANLEITSDDSDEGTVNVALSGTGVSAAANNPPDQPQLVYPADGQQNLPTTVTLKWDPVTDPDGDPVSYDLYYCEDTDPYNNCASVQVASLEEKTDKPLYAGFGYGGGLILFGIVFAAGFRDRKRIGLLAVMFIFAGTLLVSCSDDNYKTYDYNYKYNYKTYTVTGLNSGAAYYWGVVAKDNNGAETQSDVWEFTTE